MWLIRNARRHGPRDVDDENGYLVDDKFGLYPRTDVFVLRLRGIYTHIYTQARYRQHVGKAVIDSLHCEAELVWPR